MTWLQRYRVRHYLTNSLWIAPVLSMIAAIILAQVIHAIEETWGWKSTHSPGTAQALLGTMAASMFTFIVFVSSALLISVQLASSTLTPRIIGIVYRDRVTKACLVVFVFTFTFTLAVLARVSVSVPLLTAYLAVYGSLASLGLFLYLIDHVGKALRPSGALWAVAVLGQKAIEQVYPKLLEDSPEPLAANELVAPLGLPRVIPSQRDGVVLAFDVSGLAALAQRVDCVIELAPQVGDFIAIGDPLFRVYGDATGIETEALFNSVAVGQERTMEQDPSFAFRIIVDIASKGLSPAINDPTTAVLALDQIHHLLRLVGMRRLDDERVRDRTGRLRLLYRTPDWADFVQLAVTEIRQFGGGSIQVNRRLRAMLKNLIELLPRERGDLLRQELELLHRSAERAFVDPEDRALAEGSDLQGMGGNQTHHHKVRGGQEPHR
jgi:uncharacterized membrane protein